jgi:hypothetical protein
MHARWWNIVLLTIILLGLESLSAAWAAIITTPAPMVSGPGGTGTAMVNSSDPNFLDVLKTYTSNERLDVTFTVDSAGGYGLQEFIGNDTGLTWSGFQYDLLVAPAGSEFVVALDLSGHFAIPVPNNGPPITSFTFLAGAVASGDDFTPIIGFEITGPGEITIRQTPLAAAIPEPATALLLTTGVLGLLGYGWLRSRVGRGHAASPVERDHHDHIISLRGA